MPFLRDLITPVKQDHHFIAPLDEVDAIAGAVIDTHFIDAAEILGVTKLAYAKTINPLLDTKLSGPILEGRTTLRTSRLADFDHM
jgi:hypothetical protein